MANIKSSTPKAYKLYKAYFSDLGLKTLYKSKISSSFAIGKDGVRKFAFEKNLNNEIALILRKTQSKTYEFTSYKEKLISKGVNKYPRQISIPTRRDRLTLRALCEILTTVFGDAVSRPPQEYIKEIKAIAQKYDDTYCFLRIDVKDYYPSINHKKLLRQTRKRIRKPEIITLLEKSIKTPTGNSDLQPDKGIPQGLSISNILSSIYLFHLDQKYRDKIHYFRYVDDILIICPLKESQATYLALEKDLRKVGLKCHQLDSSKKGKTTISTLSKGIDYLGYEITNHSISVRKSSYQRMFENITRVFTSYKYSKTKNKELLVFRLNLKISGCIADEKRYGWMFFFSQTENKSQLKYLDEYVRKLITSYDLTDIAERVKTFIKSYHEIRYRIHQTQYIEKFEAYSLKQKRALVALLSDKERTEIDKWSKADVEEAFERLSLHEARQLEKDLIHDS